MEKSIFFVSLLVLCACGGDREWSSIRYDASLCDSFFDTQNWDYPWYVMKDEEGNFSSAMGDTVTAADTVHLYHTARFITNHQGEHELNYCTAHRLGDTLILEIAPPFPAYWAGMQLTLTGNKFKAVFGGEPFATPISIKWKTIRQELMLNTKNYLAVDNLKGSCIIEFEEIINDSIRQTFYFNGVFKTRVEP